MKKLWMIVLAVFLLAECTKEKKVTTIQLDKKTLELRVLSTYQFTVLHEPAELQAPEYLWSSSNNDIATISYSGLLTAVGEGSATITVVSPGTQLSSSCQVVVLKQLANQIEMDKEILELDEEQSDVLTYILFPEGSTLSIEKWESSDEEVVSVSQNGTVTAISVGEAVVTVSDQDRPDIEASCTIKVSPKQADFIQLNREELTLLYNQEELLTYTLLPEGSILKEPFWSSVDADIATVDQNGKVTGKSEGSTMIQLYSLSKLEVTASCQVTVVRPVATSIVLNRTELTIEKNVEWTLTYTSLPQFSLIESVYWSSSNESVATVDSHGKVTPITEGTTIITVTDATNPEIQASCNVTITSISATDISFSIDETEIFVGDWITLNYTLQPQGAALSQPEWSSDNPLVASVDQDGKVTGLSQGTAIITLRDNIKPEVFAKCTITVSIIPITSIALDQTVITTRSGNTHTLTISLFPANATPPATYYWSSSDEWVATVNQNGVVQALRVGEVTIRVEVSEGLYATCTVTVSPVYNSWREPALLFGGTQAAIRSVESRRVNSTLTNFAGSQAIVYDGESGSRLQHCVYVFASGLMAGTLLAFADNDQTAIASARGYCAERYRYIGESGGITVYQNREGVHIEIGFRNLTDYVQLTAFEKLAMSMIGLKNRWFIISYSR